MIPLLYYVPPLLGAGQLPIQEVAGLSMTQVLAAALMGAWSHGRHALVHHRLAWIGGAAIAGAAAGGGAAPPPPPPGAPPSRLRSHGPPPRPPFSRPAPP